MPSFKVLLTHSAGQQFLRDLLEPNPNKQLKIKDVVLHPWFCRNSDDDAKSIAEYVPFGTSCVSSSVYLDALEQTSTQLYKLFKMQELIRSYE